MKVQEEDVSPCITLNVSKAHGMIICKCPCEVISFTQNTREEVRVIGDGNVAGCLASEPGTHQTTFLCQATHSHKVKPLKPYPTPPPSKAQKIHQTRGKINLLDV